jgi:hypothetical protein
MTEIRVRMYRQFLGDCFLLTFGQNQAHMLIDCGVIGGTQGAAQKMQAVAQDIHNTTGGRLDVLVATHEHWDHLSGFLQAQDIFDKLTVENVWLAWTENPNDEVAKSLLDQRSQAKRTVSMAIERLGMLGAAGQQSAERLGTLMDFFEEERGTAFVGAVNARTTEGAIKWVATRPGAKVHYRSPDEDPITLKGVEGVRIYVLGPPRDVTLIKRDLPSKRDPETYELAFAGGLEEAFMAAALAHLKEPEKRSTEEEDEIQRSQPFDLYHQILVDRAKSMSFFQDNYGFADPALDSQSWRRIDSDWLDVAGQLALKLDSDTNNTSLVLAIELISSGKVLLFAADAQVGNWLSWERLSWNLPAIVGSQTNVKAADLLRRTVLYKVGHHGSHNATLREKGLELMSSPDLVAMIPVEEEMAMKKKWNKMPFPPLVRRLNEKTGGRVLRSDKTLSAQNAEGEGPVGWRVTQDPRGLYFDYILSG